MKKMHWIAIVIGIVTALGMLSCSKPDHRSLYCDTPSTADCTEDTNFVNMRVINFTDYPLCDFEVQYSLNNATVHNYGTLDPDEFTCYSAMSAVNVYPKVTFTLGTGKFKVIDSLLDLPKYNLSYISSKGYYSLFINIAPDLDSQLVITSIVPEF